MKKGLILEGGGMRGMYTAGVLDVFMEEGITVDGAVGVSAGAVFGCNYKSLQKGRPLRYNLRFCRDKRYFSWSSFIKTGDLFNEEFCYHEIPDRLDPFDVEAYQKNPMEFYVTCTDVATGNAVYHLCERGNAEDIQWMRASASMPMVSRVVELDGMGLLDGGIADSIPITWFRSIGYEKNIVILTQPEGYRKEKNKSLPVMKRVMRKYPAVYEAMAKRHEVYNDTLDELERLEKAGEVLILRPSRPLHVGRTERDGKRLKMLYTLGTYDAKQNLEKIREFQKDRN